MKNTILFLLGMLILVACAAPATPTTAPAQTLTPEPTSPTNLVEAPSSPASSTNINREKGSIEGTISWLDPNTSAKSPIKSANLEINGHSDGNPRYTTEADLNGHFAFVNIEPIKYGVGIYLNLPISERMCEAPEYQFSQDLGWLHYATALRGDIWYDILFSNEDVTVKPGETVVLDFVLKCP